ncbi:MAG: hypothetical protein LC623_05890, partial [Halobacteriales archaeon]|nr:hypothetical protein [Halobacteriales archaeon]
MSVDAGSQQLQHEEAAQRQLEAASAVGHNPVVVEPDLLCAGLYVGTQRAWVGWNREVREASLLNRSSWARARCIQVSLCEKKGAGRRCMS